MLKKSSTILSKYLHNPLSDYLFTFVSFLDTAASKKGAAASRRYKAEIKSLIMNFRKQFEANQTDAQSVRTFQILSLFQEKGENLNLMKKKWRAMNENQRENHTRLI